MRRVSVAVLVAALGAGAPLGAAVWEVRQLTSDNVDDIKAYISESHAVWRHNNGNPAEAFYYDGVEVVQVSNKKTPRLYANDDPAVSGSRMVWMGYANNYDLWMYDAAKTAAQRTAFARKLLKAAAGMKTEKDAAGRFAVLRVAREVALQAGDLGLTLDCIARLDRAYKIDALAMQEEALEKAARSAGSPGRRKAVAREAVPLIEAAVAAEDFERADRLAALAHSAAQRSREFALLRQIAARRRQIGKMAAAYAKVKAARATLQTSPTDPDANLTVGRFLCLVKGDWGKGIPMLALGSDAELKALAQKDLRGAPTAADQAALGDAWWELAQSKSGPDRDALLPRAGYWYRLALAQLPSGLTRMKLQKRLEEVPGGAP